MTNSTQVDNVAMSLSPNNVDSINKLADSSEKMRRFYLRKGFAPFFSRIDFNGSDKVVQTGRWKEYSPDVQYKKSLRWPKKPNTMYLRTGEEYGLLVVDIDLPAVDVWFSFLKEHKEINTTVVRSGSGGYHWWFKFGAGHPHLNESRKRFGLGKMWSQPGIDIRGNDGIIFCPGGEGYDRNGKTAQYKFIHWVEPEDLPEVPAWLCKALWKLPESDGKKKKTAVTPAVHSSPLKDIRQYYRLYRCLENLRPERFQKHEGYLNVGRAIQNIVADEKLGLKTYKYYVRLHNEGIGKYDEVGLEADWKCFGRSDKKVVGLDILNSYWQKDDCMSYLGLNTEKPFNSMQVKGLMDQWATKACDLKVELEGLTEEAKNNFLSGKSSQQILAECKEFAKMAANHLIYYLVYSHESNHDGVVLSMKIDQFRQKVWEASSLAKMAQYYRANFRKSIELSSQLTLYFDPFNEWLESPYRIDVAMAVCEIGKDILFVGDDGRVFFNGYIRPAFNPEHLIEEVKADYPPQKVEEWCKKIEFHLKEVICNGKSDAYIYLNNYLIELLKNPSFRPNSCPVITGPPGSGKTTFFQPFLSNYFGNAYTFSDTSNFTQLGMNDKLIGKTCVLLDEMNMTDKTDYDKFKNFITSDVVNIRSLYVKDKPYRNFAKFIICSNHARPIKPALPNERRLVYINTSTKYANNGEYFDELYSIPWEIYAYFFVRQEAKKVRFDSFKTEENKVQCSISLNAIEKWLCVQLQNDAKWILAGEYIDKSLVFANFKNHYCDESRKTNSVLFWKKLNGVLYNLDEDKRVREDGVRVRLFKPFSQNDIIAQFKQSHSGLDPLDIDIDMKFKDLTETEEGDTEP